MVVDGSQKLELLLSPSAGIASNPGEQEREFRIRLQQATVCGAISRTVHNS